MVETAAAVALSYTELAFVLEVSFAGAAADAMHSEPEFVFEESFAGAAIDARHYEPEFALGASFAGAVNEHPGPKLQLAHALVARDLW